MLALYHASVKYMFSERQMLGETYDGRTDSQAARVVHFCESLAALPKDVDDSSAVQEELQKETTAFTPEQRKEMASAVSVCMRNSSAATSVGNKTQKHLFLHNYLPDAAWSTVSSKGFSWDVKMEYFVDFCLAIGLRYPNDDTVRCIIAILGIQHERTLSPQDGYDAVHEFRTKMVNKRPLYPGMATMEVFPEDPSPFMRLYRGVYLECEPPVASRIDMMKIRQMCRKDLMPTRSSNAQIHGSSASASRSTSPKDSNAAMMQFMLGHLGQHPPAPPTINMNPQPKCLGLPPPQAGSLALTDHDEAAAPADPHDVVQNIIAQAKAVLKKGIKEKAEETESESEADDADEEESDEMPLKRPSASKSDKLKGKKRKKKDKKGTKKGEKKDKGKKGKKGEKDKKDKKVKKKGKGRRGVELTPEIRAKLMKKFGAFFLAAKARIAKRRCFVSHAYHGVQRQNASLAKHAYKLSANVWDELHKK